MNKRKANRPGPKSQPPARTAEGAAPAETTLRIIGGVLGGRKLFYSGDERTRPMKDRVRESVFNLLHGNVVGAHAIDLFAGAGALGLEAVSRGAKRATFVERHFPTAELIERSASALGVKEICQVVPGDAFIWGLRRPDLGPDPWLVFSSPPYSFYVDRADDMLALIGDLFERAPLESAFVVEADERFDFGRLPRAGEWDERHYPPAHVAILRKT